MEYLNKVKVKTKYYWLTVQEEKIGWFRFLCLTKQDNEAVSSFIGKCDLVLLIFKLENKLRI